MIITSPYRCGCAFEVNPACSLSPLNCCHNFYNQGNMFCNYHKISCGYRCGQNFNCKHHNIHNNIKNCPPLSNGISPNEMCCNTYAPCNLCCTNALENSFFFLAGILLSQKHLH